MFTYLQIRVCSELEHDKIRLKVSEANKAAKSGFYVDQKMDKLNHVCFA